MTLLLGIVLLYLVIGVLAAAGATAYRRYHGLSMSLNEALDIASIWPYRAYQFFTK